MKPLKYFLFPSCLSFILPLFGAEESDVGGKNHFEMQSATESYESAFIKTILVLVLLIGLAVLTVWIFRKISNGRLRNFNYSKAVKIIEKRPLSPKSMLYLIEAEGKRLLIAESQVEVRQLAILEDSPSPDL